MFEWLVDLDKWANWKIFRGNKGETISSRLGRKIEDKDCWACRWFCRLVLLPLAIVLRNDGLKHCRDSIDETFRDK